MNEPDAQAPGTQASAGTDLHGANVLILGLGLLGGGVGVTRYFVEHGARLRITDLRSADELRPTLETLADIDAEYVLGEHRESDIAWADLVLRNPGVPPGSPFLTLARELGTPVEMELSYVVKHNPAHLSAVTGTKGKTTTTTLLHQLLESTGERVHLAGNMGVSAIALLDDLRADDHLLLEISCQQLEGRLERGWPPDVAVITNVEDDHVERYGSMDAYRRVKSSLAQGQGPSGWTILPAWDRELASLCAPVPSRKVFVADARRPFEVEGLPREAVVEVGDTQVTWTDETGTSIALCGFGDFGLLGRHNQVNLAFAAAAAYVNGRAADRIAAATAELSSPDHRLQVVATGAGLRFVNDSAATAPIAVVSALEALSHERVVLICGGVAKGSDFDPMVAAIEKSGAPVVLLPGSGTDVLVEALDRHARHTDVVRATDMTEAVARAVEIARAHQATCVALSPGCASFGLFLNEFDRGRAFVREALAYADRASDEASDAW